MKREKETKENPRPGYLPLRLADIPGWGFLVEYNSLQSSNGQMIYSVSFSKSR